MVALFGFTIRQVLWQRRIGLAILLLLFPAGIVLLVRNVGPGQPIDKTWDMYHMLMQFLVLTLLVPLICILYGSALIGAEVEQRTLIYLTTRKLRRAAVLLVRFAATWAVLSVLVVLALLVLHLCVTTGLKVAGGIRGAAGWQPWQDLQTYLLVAPGAVAGFLAVFTTISLVFVRPLIISTIYLVTFELILSHLPVAACQLSISHALRLTLVKAMPQMLRLYDGPSEMRDIIYPPGATGTGTLLIAIAALLVVASVLVSVRELVPSKVSRD